MMARVKVAIISATVVAAIVFLGYSVPAYYQLAAHQPGHATSAGVTSFPPSSAFFFGGWLALLCFVAVCLIFLIIRATVVLLSRRKNSTGTRIIEPIDEANRPITE
jgi:hypothetical protein